MALAQGVSGDCRLLLTREVVKGGSGTEGSTLKMIYSRGLWQEGSVPYHIGFSIRLLEYSHDMASGFAWNE